MLPHLVYFIIVYAPLVGTVSPQAKKCDVQYVIVLCCFIRVESFGSFNFFHSPRDFNKTVILFKVCLAKGLNCICRRGMFPAHVFTVCFSMVQEQQLIVLTYSEAVIVLHILCYGYLS